MQKEYVGTVAAVIHHRESAGASGHVRLGHAQPPLLGVDRRRVPAFASQAR
jgi:hypothetical protein